MVRGGGGRAGGGIGGSSRLQLAVPTLLACGRRAALCPHSPRGCGAVSRAGPKKNLKRILTCGNVARASGPTCRNATVVGSRLDRWVYHFGVAEDE